MAKDRAVHTDRPPLRVTSVAMSGANPGQWRFLLDLARCALASVHGQLTPGTQLLPGIARAEFLHDTTNGRDDPCQGCSWG